MMAGWWMDTGPAFTACTVDHRMLHSWQLTFIIINRAPEYSSQCHSVSAHLFLPFQSETIRNSIFSGPSNKHINIHRTTMGGMNICLSIFWLFILLFLVWPLAFALVFVWIFLQPFEACCPVFRSINDFIERLVTWPRDFGHAIAYGRSSCPYP